MAKRYGKEPSKRTSTITILWWRNMALQRGGNKKADDKYHRLWFSSL
ncbi:hypothetical protein ambt_16700 [Alteromonas naphthalenivorans]|uniref:Uncharacterized protein n=1 Tax=Alteromonas naphthalenivorans TaxID=715451 RepID=F5ZF68_ALTNA|nr:hypothetical protein ambt_16700 [Alteromonas naphthalenivorans]